MAGLARRHILLGMIRRPDPLRFVASRIRCTNKRYRGSEEAVQAKAWCVTDESARSVHGVLCQTRMQSVAAHANTRRAQLRRRYRRAKVNRDKAGRQGGKISAC